ncbi:MAG: hypothetical protein P8M73_12025 [Luminiphilus sp.]|jgi:hypothetical protein|nr:hypothetical protein [Luminiphilus sp.]
MTESMQTRANHQHLPLLLERVVECCVTEQHTFDADRATRTLAPLWEYDELGVGYLIDDDQGYSVVT